MCPLLEPTGGLAGSSPAGWVTSAPRCRPGWFRRGASPPRERMTSPREQQAWPAQSRAFLGQLGARLQGGGCRVPRAGAGRAVTSASFSATELRSSAPTGLFVKGRPPRQLHDGKAQPAFQVSSGGCSLIAPCLKRTGLPPNQDGGCIF